MMDGFSNPKPESSEPVYSYRPSLLGAPWEFRMTPAALVWQVGRHSGRVSYGDIQQVRLLFRPSAMQTKQFLTEIWLRDGPKLTVSSLSWKSMVEQERQDGRYRAFVLELHRRMTAAGTKARFLAGISRYLYWPGLAVFLLVALGLAAIIVRALQTAAFTAAAFICVFLLLFLWQTGGYFHRNRPGIYRPDLPPPDLLPRA